MNRKRIFKYLCLILILIMFNTCSQFSSNSSPADKLTNQLIRRVSQKLSKIYNLKLSAIGGGQDKEGVWLITAMYDLYGKPLNVKQARIIIVNMVEEYLNEVNNDEKLRPYLKNYPFTIMNLNLDIITYKNDQTDYFDPDLDTISTIKMNIDYTTRDPNNPYNYKDSFTEKYADALEIVRNSGQLISDKQK